MLRVSSAKELPCVYVFNLVVVVVVVVVCFVLFCFVLTIRKQMFERSGDSYGPSMFF